MLYSNHSRSFKDNLFVYPVLSRRSKGISVGINLNPDKRCNFDCIYCQVDRTTPSPRIPLDINRIADELTEMLDLVKTGSIFSISPFDKIPSDLRKLSDIAISGDGEPTTSPYFSEAIKEILRVKGGCFDDLKLVLITNASNMNSASVQDAIDLMYLHNGEVWAKLDAGSDLYYMKVSRTKVPFREIIQNITTLSRKNPVVIQSCFNKIDGMIPSPDEIECYSILLNKIREKGGMIGLVQIYTTARPPAELYVTPLSKKELILIANKVEEITDLAVEIYG